MATEYYYKCSFCEQESPITAKLCANNKCGRRLNIYGVAMSREAESPFDFPPEAPLKKTASPQTPPSAANEDGYGYGYCADDTDGGTAYGYGLTSEPSSQPPDAHKQKAQKTSGIRAAIILIPAAVLLTAAVICAVVFLVPWNGGRSQWEDNVLLVSSVNSGDLPDQEDFHGFGIPRNRIVRVTFLDTLQGMPQDARDVSRDQNGSVMAWLEETDDFNFGYDLYLKYHLYIAADGGVNGILAAERLFSNFTSLEEVTFNGAFHTDDTTSMRSMFYGCSALTQVDEESLNTGSVTDMHCMFYNCSSLTELDITGFDVEQVKDFSFMFRGCASLERLALGNFNAKQAETTHSMFYDCSALTTLDVSRFNTENVKDFSRMFQNCSGLTKLNLESFDTSQAQDMSMMFLKCSNLEELDLSGFDTNGVTSFLGMFSKCESLIKLNLGSIQTAQAKNMSSMFQDCHSLLRLDLSGFDTGNVQDMSAMFSGCTVLDSLNLGSFNTEKVENMRYMFAYCSSLTELNLDSFETGLVTDMCHMFDSCTSLRNLDVTGFNTGNAEKICHMFRNCGAFVDASGFDISSVVDSDGFLENASGLSPFDN